MGRWPAREAGKTGAGRPLQRLRAMAPFTDRVCIVAGGARGIGATAATMFVNQGGRVVIGDVNEDLGRELEAELGDAALFVPLDVAEPDSCRQMVERTLGHFGRVDSLVNCAIRMAPGPLAELSLESWNRVVEVGLTGTFLMCQAVGRQLIRQGDGGSIVNLSSMAGLQPYTDAGAYSSVKAAVIMLSQQLAIEWSEHGIRVNSVCPGHILTPLTAYLADPEVRKARSEATPLGRVGEPVDVAGVILFLLSDAADYVTAAELVVDGGVTKTIFSHLPGRRFG
jgi:NAD(P)-dependent dehydrogenase (short-subunit alcohol dehydrogenase family)